MNALSRAAFVLLVPLLLSPRARAEPPLEGALVGIWMMGQSLCDGSESLPILTPADTGWGNFAFARGVRTWVQGDFSGRPEERPAEQFALVPLTAKQMGGLGETMANGLADHLKAAAPRAATHFLVAYAGQGGRTIGELSAADESTDPRTPEIKRGGGGYYRTSLDDARRAVAQAKQRGVSLKIGALVWMQGEANGGPTGGIVPSRWAEELPRPKGQQWYRDRLLAYRRQWAEDLRAITGQPGDIPMFTYQTLGPAGFAQVMAADADPQIHLVGPHYATASAINSRTTNGRYGAAIHLSADAERWYGEQVGKVISRVLSESEEWQPLRPRRAWLTQSGREIVVEFTVPRPPLVLEERWLPREESATGGSGYGSLGGFVVRGANGAPLPIADLRVDGPNRVTLELAQPLTATIKCELSYGQPYAGELGRIAEIREGAAVAGQRTTELWLAGAWPERLRPLLEEGAFYAANQERDDRYAQATIRWVREEAGRTILCLERRELRNGVDFKPGQRLTALRPFSYGNLRDSDAQKAIFCFTDAAYGRRAGLPYPLWNWCILFDHFPVAQE